VTELWSDLQALFDLVDRGHASYGVPAYNGGLFSTSSHPFLAEKSLPDWYLARVIDQLGRGAGFSRDDTPTAKLKKLDALLARAAVTSEAVAFIADLLSLPNSQHTPLPSLTPQRKKQMTLEALIRWLEGLARQQPLVMVFEDAHWIDPTSRELLDLVVEHVRSLPMLLVVTFRPEFQVPWTGRRSACLPSTACRRNDAAK
jgi:predicted ATPase